MTQEQSASATDIWASIGQATATPAAPNLNAALAQALIADAVAPASAALYAELSDRLRPSQQTPQRISDFTLEHYTAESASGESYWVLKNNSAAAYLRLSDEQAYLWSLMDGQHSLRDINLAYLKRFGKISPTAVSALLDNLENDGFLLGSGSDLYEQMRHKLTSGQPRSLWQRLRALLAVGNFQFAVHNLDRRLSALARVVNPVLFHPLALAAYLVISVVGLVIFLIYLFSPQYSGVADAPARVSWWAAVLLYVAYFVSIFAHELAHALACKRFGHEVRRGGLLLYYGLPAFFVDTDDMWLADRRARVMVSWAGPLATFIVGAICTIIIYLLPAHGANGGALVGLLYSLAVMSYVNAFFNLNPLLELDGYFMLMDWLEIPALRRRAFQFVFQQLPRRVLHLQPLTRDERLLAGFGLLSLVFTVFTVWLGINFFADLVSWLSGLFRVNLNGWPALLLGAIIIALLSRRSLTALLRRVR